MSSTLTIQGRTLGPDDVAMIQALIADHPDWHRTRLSRELCAAWEWTDGAGRRKDMACRSMLLKLERRGLIQLPARRRSGVNHRRGAGFQPVFHDDGPISRGLSELGGVSLSIADSGSDRALWETLIRGYHYLGFKTRVGASVCYLARASNDRPVGALLFGAAAWKTAPRDAFIGWDPETRRRNLRGVVNNMRFLIPPWTRVPHLASHLLSLALRRLSSDWESKYGHPVFLAETFVERDRFEGTCYKAANWIHLGETTGRTRNDADKTIREPVKSIYVRPLRRDFRRRLNERRDGA